MSDTYTSKPVSANPQQWTLSVASTISTRTWVGYPQPTYRWSPSAAIRQGFNLMLLGIVAFITRGEMETTP